MTRRAGLSLMEVLTALFILALGTIAILTMFPLGALQMAQAVRDDRSATAAFAGDNYFRTYWKHNVVEPMKQNQPADPFVNAFTSPGTSPAGLLPPLGPNDVGVSYPVFVDPMGYVARVTGRDWVGDQPSPANTLLIPRRNLAVTNNNQVLAQRICSSMDGLGYTDDGVPTNERELRYNFLWVVQLPNHKDKANANLTIVVFDRRAHLYAPPGSEQVFSSVVFTPNTSSVVIPGQPDLKPGAWVMDASIIPSSRVRHANFYQVTAVTPQGASTQLELQSPIKKASNGSDGAYTGTLVILRGVSGVFVRPPLTGE